MADPNESGLLKPIVALGIAIWASVLPMTNGRAETTAICGQSVNYAVTPPAPDISPELRALSGIWVGDAIMPLGGGVAVGTMCIGFVIESIGPNATVSAKYVWGDRVKSLANGMGFSIKPGARTWAGKMTGNVLRFVSSDGRYGFELRVTNIDEMRGVYSSPDGRGEAQMRRR